MGKVSGILLVIALLVGALFVYGMISLNDQVDSEDNDEPIVLPSRLSSIPEASVKVTPETDITPPLSESDEYYDPVPVPGLVNTAGGEDSAFVMPDGETLYFFFTPDVNVSILDQSQDQVTGIYVSRMEDGSWGEAERVLLQEPSKLALDGCEFIRGDVMFFVSAREGYTGLHWFRAEQVGGEWVNWVNVDDELHVEEYETGELHITSDGQELYFHSGRDGGYGGYDIWVSTLVNNSWGEPVNVEAVNGATIDGWPFITEDGLELWFSRDWGVWRSKKVNGTWQTPERMFYPLAGESSMDDEGNVYFTHHFYRDDVMLEADIYVAYRE